MVHQIFLDDLRLKGKHIRISGIDDNSNPMDVGRAKRFDPDKILDHPTGFGIK
jgi:hypothetical protein